MFEHKYTKLPRVSLESNKKVEYNMDTIVKEIASLKNEQEEKAIVDALYEIYKEEDKGFTAYIIGRKEFEDFLKTMIPIYVKICKNKIGITLEECDYLISLIRKDILDNHNTLIISKASKHKCPVATYSQKELLLNQLESFIDILESQGE